MIQTIRDYFTTQPIEKAWIFGSYARGEEHKDSDVDLLVTLDSNANVDLLQYVHIINELKRMLNKEVDMVVEGTLLPFAAKSANQDKKLIYERGN
jgi:predicted nucleotidyltransferase